ncbi:MULTISPECIES: bis(5'-nucleosyl)-tetraphosphatase (symmetrical) YqeK [unclassified Paenibacillus]|uniref:bis(5'-nucleosyl)-tetraphosphatase (symmetrical) YqeK n=1 Tax=unclassified Paenibacillus TaxID=185978 RepID=UPI001AE4A934|nr:MULTISPECIES: bis(5'-nucleosyl)-tetraphosphatase (symmetrical) YqeK [unclassified Paenibacillus]MBP1156385.1 putative HD superfamily hydrolase involved in NAD metabolism [Paenibacillus sp. PvP091]MBP1168229.1 putative HD superfamily hydrolase involved in NAD metabolism [Paenibacillus sp. PvR098]MBP2439257.1 putative HD superfamily hydrolase involved in NAD metabolism [Paenibacillus sp. PvP052]
MKREDMIESVRSQMPEKRWNHTLGVMETAVKLAERFGADPVKADLAALLHDVCKYWRVDEQARIIRENGLPLDLLEYDKELWHAHAGAWVAGERYGVQDEEVLDAIRYHTSGRARMTLLDKVVCLADYMEPGRDFPGVHNIREIAEYSLEKALLAGFDGTIRFLLDKGKRIYPMTLAARNALIEELGQQDGASV